MIDVERLLRNTPFWDEFTVTKTTITAGTDGRAAATYKRENAEGCVYPAGHDLMNMEGGQIVTGAIVVVTTYPLVAGNDKRAADMVTFQGEDYRVANTKKYHHTQAFVEAYCAKVT